MKISKTLSGLALSAVVFAGVVSPVSASTSVVKVRPDDMATSLADVIAKPDSWFFYNDETDAIDNTLGSFVSGPAITPEGTASVQISVSGTQRRNLATYQFAGTSLADITTLAFSTYNASASNSGSTSRSGYLQFNVDFDGSDTWQRRMLFLPSDNGTVVQDMWQEWSNSSTALWRYSGPTWPGTAIPGSTPRTWSDVLVSYPGVRVRVTDAFLGIRIGEPYADGYTENLDAVKFGVGSDVTIFDFELAPVVPQSKDECKKGGWATFTDVGFKNQGDCVSWVNHNS